MEIRRGGSVASGCHTNSRSQPDDSRAVAACRPGPTRRSAPPPPRGPASGSAHRVLGPSVLESVGDHDREAPTAGPYVARGARAADARDAAAAGTADRAGAVPDPPHVGAAAAGVAGDLAGPDRVLGPLPGGR